MPLTAVAGPADSTFVSVDSEGVELGVGEAEPVGADDPVGVGEFTCVDGSMYDGDGEAVALGSAEPVGDGEDLPGAGQVQDLQLGVGDDGDASGGSGHAPILGARPGGGNDNLPTIPAIRRHPRWHGGPRYIPSSPLLPAC